MGKTVNVEDGTWTRLTKLKAEMLVESLNDVVVKLLQLGEQEILSEVEENRNRK